MIVVLLGLAGLTSWALWKSHWLAERTVVIRAVIVISFIVVYCSAAWPAIAKLVLDHKDPPGKAAEKPLNSGPQCRHWEP
jgi:hypothetical protein